MLKVENHDDGWCYGLTSLDAVPRGAIGDAAFLAETVTSLAVAARSVPVGHRGVVASVRLGQVSASTRRPHLTYEYVSFHINVIHMEILYARTLDGQRLRWSTKRRVPECVVVRGARVVRGGAAPAVVVRVVGHEVSSVEVRRQDEGNLHDESHHRPRLGLNLTRVNKENQNAFTTTLNKITYLSTSV